MKKIILFILSLFAFVLTGYSQAPTCPGGNTTIVALRGGSNISIGPGWSGGGPGPDLVAQEKATKTTVTKGITAINSTNAGCPSDYLTGFSSPSSGFGVNFSVAVPTLGTFNYNYAYQTTPYTGTPPSCTAGTPFWTTCSSKIIISVVNFGTVNKTLCVNSAPLPVSAFMTGTSSGTMTGPGVSSNTFDPAAAGPGTHTLNITGTFVNGSASGTATVIVVGLPAVDFSALPTQVCKDAANSVVFTSTPTLINGPATAQSLTIDGSGVSFPATFNPASFAPGDHTIVYTLNNANCGTVTSSHTVKIGENYSITPNANYSLCEGGTLNLATTTPPTVPGGVTGTGAWSGTGISGTTFTTPDIPSSASVDYTATYAYTGSGGYQGCNKSITKTITVKPKADLSFANTSVQECASDIIFLNSKFVPRANGSAVTPQSWTTGSLSSNYNAADQSINAGNVVVSGSQQTFPLSFTFTNSFSCVSTSANVSLVLDKIPNAPANTTASLTGCGNKNFTLTASGAVAGESYVWRNEAGTTVGGSGASYSTGTLGVGTFVYTVAVRGINGCESKKTNIVLTVNPNPTINATVASVTKCTGSYTTNLFNEYGISTSGTGTSQWSSSNGTVNAKINQTTGVIDFTGLGVSSNVPIVYSFTSTEGCAGTINLTLNINEGAPTPAVDNIKLCTVGAAVLQVTNAQGTATYNWYDAPTGGNLLGTGVGFTTAPLTAPQNASQTYSFYVSASTSNCTSARTEAIVTVVNTDQVVAGVNLSFCDNTGRISDLRGDASPAGGTFSGTGVTYVGITPVFNCGASCGISLLPNNENYTITYTYTNSGCTYTDTRQISLGFKPVLTITPEVSANPLEVQIGEYVRIEHNFSDATETTWTFVGEGAGAIGNPVGRTFYTAGYKSVDVTIKRAGCQGTFTATNIIYVEEDDFDVVTGYEDPLVTLKGGDVYPNPLNGALAIEMKSGVRNVNFSLINASGTALKSVNKDLVSGSNEILDAGAVAALSPGVYFLKIGQAGKSYTLKLIKN